MKTDFWVEMKEVLRPMLAYWLLLGFSMICFFAAIFLTDKPDSSDIKFLMATIFSTVVPILLGQVADMWRVILQGFLLTH